MIKNTISIIENQNQHIKIYNDLYFIFDRYSVFVILKLTIRHNFRISIFRSF